MRRPIIAGNWKMHKTISETVAMIKELAPLVAGAAAEVAVCPPFTALAAAKAALAGTAIRLGAQDVHSEKQGAYTGEVAPGRRREAGCDYVIVGHSERRQYFAETDETVNKKLAAAFAHGLVPIMCVGETLAEREAGATERVVDRQVRGGLAGMTAEQVAAMVIAYEPVWAIGTGRTASADDADGVCAFIRRLVAALYGPAAADAVRIQYGGSVKADNIAEFMAKSDIDGALVGGASLDPVTFAKIAKY